MFRKIWLAVVLAMQFTFAFGSGLTARAEGPVINLARDADADGIPDALAEAVDRVAMSQDKTAAILELASRLPYSPETRALQQEVERLQHRLATVKDQDEAKQIVSEIRALSDRMMADPDYARTIKALEAALLDRSRKHSLAAEDDVRISGVNWGDLRRGDILLAKGNDWLAWIYAMKYSHVGNYDGGQRVYEANPDGVRLKPLRNWQRPGIDIGLARNNRLKSTVVETGLDWAEAKYGTDGRTPYNWLFFDKGTDSHVYCSQLVWKVHQRLGVDLDSNNWRYFLWVTVRFGPAGLAIVMPGIAPDEIALSSNVAVYAEGRN